MWEGVGFDRFGRLEVHQLIELGMGVSSVSCGCSLDQQEKCKQKNVQPQVTRPTVAKWGATVAEM